jgi:hypothetical protein
MEEEDGGADDEDVDPPVGALPRRMSMMMTKNKVQPIPEATSLFVFKPTNK